MTALANYKVPVCLIATPQFTADQKAVERKTGWASEQFIGRITHYERLPEGLAEAELKEIAQSLLPGVKDTRCAEALACYAQSSKRYVAGIEAAVKRARYYARKSGRETVNFKDIAEALKCSVIPSDTALHNALMDRSQRKGRRSAEPARNDSARTEPFAPAPTEEPRISL